MADSLSTEREPDFLVELLNEEWDGTYNRHREHNTQQGESI